MDKEKVIEALKMIKSACGNTHCKNCPFHEIDDHGDPVSCNFYDVMSVPPYDWDLGFLL